ncbi:hypothetical protein C8R43DRAFT_978181 [Mycena crocata]|nr:hypothetical protein C8R43DRAFT_978181 [Mycena crocata]
MSAQYMSSLLPPRARTWARVKKAADGGVHGNWPRSPFVIRISTFDPTRLRASDFIDVIRSTICYLEVYGHETQTVRQVPFFKFSFRTVDSEYMRPDTPMRGFLYYNIPVPSRPLSGSLRFRLAEQPTRAAFNTGTDLLYPSGFPWMIPLPNLCRLEGMPVLQSLLRHGLVSLKDVILCTQAFHAVLPPELPVVHAVGQPFALDLRVPPVVTVPGPSDLIRCEFSPSIATYGTAIVRLESSENPDIPEELVLRVLDCRNVQLRPEYAHISLNNGQLLPEATKPGMPPRIWTWNHTSHESLRMSAGLHYLHHGLGDPEYPSFRKLRKLQQWFTHPMPSKAEFEQQLQS